MKTLFIHLFAGAGAGLSLVYRARQPTAFITRAAQLTAGSPPPQLRFSILPARCCRQRESGQHNQVVWRRLGVTNGLFAGCADVHGRRPAGWKIAVRTNGSLGLTPYSPAPALVSTPTH